MCQVRHYTHERYRRRFPFVCASTNQNSSNLRVIYETPTSQALTKRQGLSPSVQGVEHRRQTGKHLAIAHIASLTLKKFWAQRSGAAG